MIESKVIRLRQINGVIYASSRHVAEDFGKDHDKVVRRDIRSLIKEIPPNLATSWFREDHYFDAYNRKQDCIDMSRQGWELVVMNYRGLIDWKVAYILKFEEMEAKLGPAGARTAALFDRTNPALPRQSQADLFEQGQPRIADNDGAPRMEQVPFVEEPENENDHKVTRVKLSHLKYEGISYTVGIEPKRGGCPIMWWVAQSDKADSMVLPKEFFTHDGKGKQVLLLHDVVPAEVVLRAYEYLPQGLCTEMALAGLRRYLDKWAR